LLPDAQPAGFKDNSLATRIFWGAAAVRVAFSSCTMHLNETERRYAGGTSTQRAVSALSDASPASILVSRNREAPPCHDSNGCVLEPSGKHHLASLVVLHVMTKAELQPKGPVSIGMLLYMLLMLAVSEISCMLLAVMVHQALWIACTMSSVAGHEGLDGLPS
jgi:hypothetical protein